MATNAMEESKLLELVGGGIRAHKIDLGSCVINYVSAGTGPNLILLHGLNMGWGQWHPNIEQLSKHFTVYAIDLPGAGASTEVHWGEKNPERQLVDAVIKFIDAKSLQQVSIVGHSVGAWVALKIALTRSSTVDKLVLVSPVGFTRYTPNKYRLLGIYWFAKMLTRTVMKPTRPNIKGFLEGAFHDAQTLQAEFIDYYHSSISVSALRHPFLFVNRISGFFKVAEEFVLIDELQHVRKPTLIIIGEKDPIVQVNQRHSKAFGLIPGAQVELFLNTGHVAAMEKSREFNELVTKFLMAQ